jgi:aldehyde dehydrogenase (NAD+)
VTAPTSPTDVAAPGAAEHDAVLHGLPAGLLIGGAWVEGTSGERFVARDPANGAALAEVVAGSAADVEHAVQAARSAFEGPWARWTPAERAALIQRLADLVEARADELALLDTLDMGAPSARARGGVASGLGRLRWSGSQAVSLHGETPRSTLPADILAYTLKVPVGVVAAIVPWNSPVASILWKLGPILATGCTAVLKPAEEASLSALRLAELCLEAGVPDGVVNVVTGAGEVVGAVLAAHPGVDKVAFTGSLATAQHIIRASAGNVKRLSLELGGKSPNIVFADADLEAAAAGAANAIFANSGQICSAGSRLFVERGAYPELVERVAEAARALRVGSGLDPASDLGPVVSEGQLDRVLGYVEAGEREGGRLLCGGERLLDAPRADGYFVAPTIFADVTDDMTVAREEIFGPVLAALPFDDADEVARRANALGGGLAAGIWTKDGSTAHRLARQLRVGTVWINCYQVMDPAMPFGGFGVSGYGREGGVAQVEQYLETTSVYADLRG